MRRDESAYGLSGPRPPIVEERLKEQEAEGVKMPEGMERDELALKVLIAAVLTSKG
jgi:hypothetical protein